VIFDPLTDPRLPPGTYGLYLGGGFPEMHASQLSANTALRAQIAAAVDAGVPTVAECAGLLYLCRSVDGATMVGALPVEAAMSDRLTLRYRSLIASHDHLLAPAGARVTGHEFHRTIADPASGERAAWLVDGQPAGFSTDPAGTGSPTLHASYLHLHWAGHPQVAQRFADAVHAFAAHGRYDPRPPGPAAADQPDLRYHGDQEVGYGLIDLAVNVRVPSPPACLIEIINEATPQLAAYPHPGEALAAIAAAHGLDEDQVLPTAGGVEAFTLIARALPTRCPVMVHPQFTEPEAALIAAGRPPSRLILTADEGFLLDPTQVPADADLIMIGNPTNPTSALHSATDIRSLLRPGRLVVVDEAFMDAVSDEAESMIGGEMPGLVVVRSLTKTWGIAGLRAGYAVGDRSVVAAMRDQQPPWSVSTPALSVITACLSAEARAMAADAAREIADNRSVLIELLAELDLQAAGSPAAPFILLNTEGLRGPNRPGWAREALRERGFAVRRGETFPGLGPDWIRIAVREPQVSRKLADALRAIDCRSARM
jgi:cobyrinic acid a,c-diamide synthase